MEHTKQSARNIVWKSIQADGRLGVVERRVATVLLNRDHEPDLDRLHRVPCLAQVDDERLTLAVELIRPYVEVQHALMRGDDEALDGRKVTA